MVGWLKTDDDEDESAVHEHFEAVNQALCINMLKVADGLLSCLDSHRGQTGIDLHARIGIATGEAVSGVLGLLQPRFCVFGEGMCRAAELEQTGSKDSVHCSPEFLDYVSARQGFTLRRRGSYNAEMDLVLRKQNAKWRTTKEQMQRKLRSGAVVTRMMSQGRLYKQQNMMTAAPGAPSGGFEPILPVRSNTMAIPESGEGLFGLGKSIDEHGNFVSGVWYDRHLRIIDANGMMLTLRGKSSVLDGEAVPKGEISMAI